MYSSFPFYQPPFISSWDMPFIRLINSIKIDKLIFNFIYLSSMYNIYGGRKRGGHMHRVREGERELTYIFKFKCILPS